jgi:hypothetical protein
MLQLVPEHTPLLHERPAQQGLVAVHDWPEPPQVVPWHRPFTQLPEQHWLLALHVPPVTVQLLPQVSVSGLHGRPGQQAWPLAHDWPVMLQVVPAQTPLLHERPLQHGLCAVHAWPAMPQVVPWQMPLRQLFEQHCALWVQAPPVALQVAQTPPEQMPEQHCAPVMQPPAFGVQQVPLCVLQVKLPHEAQVAPLWPHVALLCIE